MNKNISKAYSFLRRVTPLKYDCGELCGARCCKGDSSVGMELFHGEEELFKSLDGFTVTHSDNGTFVVCSGTCDRSTRPIACRIYPFYPRIKEKNGKSSIYIVYDIRGYSSCPVVREAQKPRLRFAAAVYMASRQLIKDSENLEIIKRTNAVFDDLAALGEIIQKENNL